MSETRGEAQNTDVTLWRNENDHIFLTKDGKGLGICSGGRCVVKPVADWVTLCWTETLAPIHKFPLAELCECGHLRRHHGAAGFPGCPRSDCPCTAFKPAQAPICEHGCHMDTCATGPFMRVNGDCPIHGEGHSKPAKGESR